jgi:hypothetical protein
MSKKYKIIALTGAAGSGKDTLIYELMNNSENKKYFNRIIRTTTRPKREGETNGVSYHFCDKEEFLKLIKDDSLLEYNVFNNWRYGIQYKDLDINKINIGEFNPYSLREICVLPNVDVRVLTSTKAISLRLTAIISISRCPNLQLVSTTRKPFLRIIWHANSSPIFPTILCSAIAYPCILFKRAASNRSIIASKIVNPHNDEPP